MTTGAFWNVSNPTKPWGVFDPDAQLDFPVDWSDWLTDAGATYTSHDITAADPLEEVSSAEQSGVITVLVKVKSGAQYTVGTKYPVTCSIVATAGALTLKDDRTLWLKVVER